MQLTDTLGLPPRTRRLRPRGRLPTTAGTQVLKVAEIPREDINLRRQPSMTRCVDGTCMRWTTPRVGVGCVEGTSRLVFDLAIQRRPAPGS